MSFPGRKCSGKTRKEKSPLRLPKIKEKIYKVEDPSVAKFLNGNLKVPKLSPLPRINFPKDDPFAKHPLIKFKLSAGKKKKVYEFLQEQAKRNKIRTCRALAEEPPPVELPAKSSLECHQELRKCAETQPIPPLQDSWIESIQKKLHGLHLRFPLIATAILEEVRTNFHKDMHEFGVNLIIKPLPGTPEKVAMEQRIDNGGKTPRYHIFLKRRAILKSNLHLLHPLQRQIFTTGVSVLPETLNDFTKYRALGVMDLATLEELVYGDIKRAEHLATTVYYGQVVDLLTEKKTWRGIPVKILPKFLSSATNILSIQITGLIHRSIEHLLWLTEEGQRMPYLSLNLVCDDCVSLFPSQQTIYKTFHKFLDRLAGIAGKLTPLETWVDDVPIPPGNIIIPVNESYLKESHLKLERNLERVLEDVNTYVDDLVSQYSSLYSKRRLQELQDFIRVGHSFEELVDERISLQEYMAGLDDLLLNEFYIIGRVCQYDLIKSLKLLTTEVCAILMEAIIEMHAAENREICTTFEDLKRKALREPESTEELMDMGVFMLSASAAMVEALEDRIGQQLRKMSIIIHLGDVPSENIVLMTETVNWISEIKPVFELNSSQYEQHKFEFEERLQKRTEALTKDLEDLGPKLVVLNNMDDTLRIPEYLQEIRKFLAMLDKLDKDVEWINHEEFLFKFPVSTYPELDELHNFVNPFARLLSMTHQWQWKYRVWMNGSFQDLEANNVETTTEQFYKDFMETQKSYKAKIKQQIQDNVARRFKGNVDDPDPNNVPVPIKICNKALEQIKNFKIHIPLVKILCNRALMQRHWDEMSVICGFEITPDWGTTLRKVIAIDLAPYLDQFEIISIGACKELQLKENLNLMRTEWSDVVFNISPWKETALKILADLDQVQALLDDHLVKTVTMRGSAFVKPFENEMLEWYQKLDRVNKTIEQWGKVQMQWLYLLPIFSSKDIASQMVKEATMFKEIDSAYRRVMENTWRSPKVLETAGSPGLLEMFETQLENLESINNGVSEYLENKRLFFPRFFFLSNDEMLEILSETENPFRVQPHLRKCFEGIAKLQFDEKMNIKAMISNEGEMVKFLNDVSTKAAGGSVEKWLVQVEHEMTTSVKDHVRRAFLAYPSRKRIQWIQEWPGQVVLCVSALYWTAEVHNELQRNTCNGLAGYFALLTDQLNSTVELVRGELSAMSRATLGALIVIDVHAKDIVESLIKSKIKSTLDFAWLAQLRYYWENEACFIQMINATIKYAYEYLGNSSRLVITPLTDRCYRTLIGAYCLHLNGAPEGPAGTGKTETTKDLAKALAVQCIVFNCSDGLDYIAMGKFFKGLASSGAWACFDEFNRIELEVLSVVAQQILSIMRAVQSGAEKFTFEGTELKLNPACYVCITMNPGYAGRSELPDNLKVLFRTVAMMVPDYALISEISLYSFGFAHARSLSVKIVTTYRLCSEQLSAQSHYDYGMRAVKTVLTAAGQLKLSYVDVDEHVLLLKALVDVNKSKLLDQDVPLFDGIIMDMFPGVRELSLDYGRFRWAIETVCDESNLQFVDYFSRKVIETYEMMKVRHGFMLVGEPYSGKSSVLRVLSGSLKKLGENTEVIDFNPKSVTLEQLYGQFDPISHDWTDGILSIAFRRFVKSQDGSRKWIVLDGPVDAVWVENLNTVLDDNKKLCLNSGEVMAMTSEMSIIFEVLDLKEASPATVSRCGMIYMEPKALGWQVLAKSWMNSQDAWMTDYAEFFWDLLSWLIPPCLNFLRKTSVGDSGKVHAMLDIVHMLMVDACKTQPWHISPWLQAALLYGGVWGLGGALDEKSRVEFSNFYLELWRGNVENSPIPECLGRADVTLPSEGTLYDYCYNFKSKGNWRYCVDMLKQEKIDEPANLAQMLVPTVETIKYSTLIQLHINHKKPVLLVGGTGTGKTFLLRNILMTKVDEDILPAFVTFTPLTTANDTQKLIISKLNKRRRDVYGPPKGQKCVLFIDDVNMPAKEPYGAQPAVELLRQYMDKGHWYDVRSGSPIYLDEILLISAVGLPGGSRQVLSPRFLRHFNVLAVGDTSEESLTRIFSALLFAQMKRNGFVNDAMTAVTGIVNATAEVYLTALNILRPTPAKSHYIFNLRDFSRVIEGCGLIKKESVDSRKTFVKLWVHETLRVFYDRLTDDKDREWLFEKIRSCVKDHFKENFDAVFDNLKLVDGVCQEESLQGLMFGRYLDQDSLEDDRKYEEATMEQLLEVATTIMSEYNAVHTSKLDLVLFKYALEHLSRICRMLSLPGGSGLLLGVSGSGRQSLVKLATAMIGFDFFQPEITTGYSMAEWRDDLKKVLKQAGGRAKSTVFLFTEAQLKEESFLGDIDSLLNLGEVPELFSLEEKQEILEMVRLAAQGGNRNLDISPLTVFNFFISRCKQKLHILLCFSPIGSNFRNRLRQYSSLVNCCTIDWFVDWPVDALEKVANRILIDVNLPADVKNGVVNASKHFHVTAKKISDDFYRKTRAITYVTSAAFIELVTSFARLTTKTQEETKASKSRYITGLEKLEFAANQVTAMSKELSELKPKLEVAKFDTMKMMEKIDGERKKVESAAELVKKDEKIANEQAAASMELKAECEADLAQAIPILEEAIAALNTLKPTDITLVKSMKNPPDAIKLVMAAVCVMKDVKPDRLPDPATGKKVLDYWGPSKRILGDMAFLQSLKDYDKDNISPEIMVKIRKEYIPHKDFKPSVVAKASSAAEGLCKWVIAMDLYDAVAKEVAPKKAKLEVAERKYAATMVLLNQKRAEVNKLEEQLGELMQKLQETQEKKQKLEDEVELCSNKLSRAEKLIDGLGGEKSRWAAAAMQLQQRFDAIAGDILISCGVISYLSAYTLTYRQDCVRDWYHKCKELNIPCSDNYSLALILGADVKIQGWHIAGLPRDDFSTDNAIILDNSDKWPLLIDPQGQANKWIRDMEKGANLEIVKIIDNVMKVAIDCMTYGKPMLIEGVLETLDPALNAILNRKNVFQQHGKFYITLRDDVIEYDPNFKLYLTSNLRNPHYPPEISNKVRVINFALTMEGLEDQLLGIVVAKERPDLQTKRQELIVKSAKNKHDLLQVEEMILRTLSETKGDILEDEKAIETLDSSKILSQAIKQEQESAKLTEKTIESFRLSYRPVAFHSAVLYYCIADLVNIDPMYQYSLSWFIKLFLSSIDSANKSKVLEKRLRFLRDTFTYDLYSNVCRSLFEKDKILFSFLLCCNILIAEEKLDRAEYLFMLSGGSALQAVENTSTWLKDKTWEQLVSLSAFPAFRQIVNDITENPQWQKFYELADPIFKDLPTTLKPFQNLLLLKILRPDRFIQNVTLFVGTEMGKTFTQPPTFDLTKSFNDSNCLCPLIFILSPGSDPMEALTAFAEKKGAKFQSVSLGQGQGPLAERLISEAQETGSWICLQNCHLAASWMPTLEKMWENMDTTNTALTFRLWLTSYPSVDFPRRVLQNSVKMTNEPPTGLKPNIKRSFTSYPVSDPAFFDGCPGKNIIFGKLLYGLTFFHAVLQERKKFGPIGWNIPYGFDESDFQISIQQLQTFIREYPEPYEAVLYLVGECNYGGRVTDEWDRRTLNTILSDFINEKVVKSPSYTFCGVFGLPRKTGYHDYLDHIEKLPQLPHPDVFGLHGNSGIAQGLHNTKALLEKLQLVEGSSLELIQADSNILEISRKIVEDLPENFDLEDASEKFPVSYSESLNALLVQEMARFNTLLIVIRNSLVQLEKAVLGFVVMTPELESLLFHLQAGKIPLIWRKHSYNTMKSLGLYITDLHDRVHFFQNWFKTGKPTSFWLSGFFSTHGFLSGVMQNFGRKHSIPLDILTFDFSVVDSPPTDNGALIYGLFLDGARWNRDLRKLDELHPRIMFDSLPNIWLQPMRKSDLDERGRYVCPLYKTPERRGTLSTTGVSTNYVFSILLDTDKAVSHWVKRGVALLCQLED